MFFSEVGVPSVISVDGSDVGVSSCPPCYQPLKVPAFLSGTTAASMVGGVRNFLINLVFEVVLVLIWSFQTLFTYPDNFRAQKAEIAAKYSGYVD